VSLRGGAPAAPRAIVVALLATCLWNVACDESPPRSSLRVGLLMWPGYEPPLLAREAGLIDRDSVSIVDYGAPSDVLRDYRDGALDAAALTVQFSSELGPDGHRIVLVIDESSGGDAIVARPGITSLAALRGRRVGVEPNPLSAYVLLRAIAGAGLDADDVETVPIDVDRTVDALHSGEVDAVVTYDPYRARLLDSGAIEIFDSASMPGEIYDVLYVHETVFEQRREEVCGLVRGWLDAVERLRRVPPEFDDSIRTREGRTAAGLIDELTGVRLVGAELNARLLGGSDAALITTIRRSAEVLAPLQKRSDSSMGSVHLEPSCLRSGER